MPIDEYITACDLKGKYIKPMLQSQMQTTYLLLAQLVALGKQLNTFITYIFDTRELLHEEIIPTWD